MATAHPKPKQGRERAIALDTPFHKFPGDLLLSTARRLGELGLDAELAEAIRQGSGEHVVRQHLHDLREALWPQRAETRRKREGMRRARTKLIHGLYTPSDQQLANVRTWNVERRWGIPEEWFEALGPAPDWPTDSKLACVTLEVALPDQPETKDADGNVVTPAIPGYIRTVRELWDIISHQHSGADMWDGFYLDAEHLKLLEGATYEPGLRWGVLDLGANWNKRGVFFPLSVHNPLTSPNVDGFAALAHHPRFVSRMDGVRVPFLWIPGFRAFVPGDDPPVHVPVAYFIRDVGGVSLCMQGVGYQHPHFAIPIRRESKRAA